MILREVVLPIAAGVIIFVFGMKVMETAMRLWAGNRMKLWLQRFTNTPLRGMIAGTGLTMAIQSSSAITVITIGLVNTGLLTFPQTLGIILGTNIGTCLTTELIGINIQSIGYPLLILASAAWFLVLLLTNPTRGGTVGRWLRSSRFLSLALAGFGCILVGIEVMQTAAPALLSRHLFVWLIEQAQSQLIWGVLLGAGITAVIQSSTAMIAMTMGLAAVQAIPVDLGIAIVLGANIGTCSTAFIAAIWSDTYGRLVALSHTILNVAGVILFFPIIGHLQAAVAWLTPHEAGQIAHAQTIFNVISSLLALPICYMPWLRTIDQIQR